MLDPNAILDKIGPWHVPVFLVAMARAFPLTFHLISLSFTASPKQDHWCARPPQFLEKYSVDEWRNIAIPIVKGKASRCLVRKYVEEAGNVRFLNETEKCSNWEFDTTYFDWTLTREFGLVCDKSWYVSASQAAFMAGLMVGNMCFSKIADRYGRRKALIWATELALVSGLVTLFCRDFWTFNVARFITAIACGAYQSTLVSILMESLSARRRAWMMLTSFSWVISNASLPSVAYLLRNWVHQHVVYALSAVPCLIQLYFVPESPRWLLASGRVERAEAAFKEVVRKNKLEEKFDVAKLFAEYRDKRQLNEGESEETSKPAFVDLFRGPRMRVRSVCVLLMYFANRLLMFNLTFFSTRMGGNPFVSFATVSLLSVPSDFIAALCIRYVKRRPSMFLTFVGTGAFILLMENFGENQLMARIVLCIIAKSLNNIGASALSVFASESFPTVVRAMGIGCAYTSSRFGAMFSPFFKELSDFAGSIVAAVVAAGIALLGAVAALCLPETLDQPLPDALSDVDPDVYGPIKQTADGEKNGSNQSVKYSK